MGKTGKRAPRRLSVTLTPEEAGIEKRVAPHTLRHTYATRMPERPGITIRDVQTLLGHANVATTQVYTHVDEDELREKVQAEDRPQPPVDPQVQELARAITALDQKQEALARALTAAD